jgi:hypothetical protein
VLFHPNAHAWHPSAEVYRTWRDLGPAARAAGHWVTDAEALLAHRVARRQSRLASRWHAGRLEAAAFAAAAGLTLALPGTAAGAPLRAVTVDGRPVVPIRAWTVGGELALVALPQGEHTVVGEYGP